MPGTLPRPGPVCQPDNAYYPRPCTNTIVAATMAQFAFHHCDGGQLTSALFGRVPLSKGSHVSFKEVADLSAGLMDGTNHL